LRVADAGDPRTWTVRPPRELQELTLRVAHAAASLSATLDRAPTVTELAVQRAFMICDTLPFLQPALGDGDFG
jgi:hypothetical protein